MRKIKQDNRLTAVILGMIVILLTMGFSHRSRLRPPVQQNKMKYEGTYSLYIEQKDSTIFHWITEQEEVGSITLKELSGTTLENGQTPQSKVHRYALEEMPGSDFVLEFGSLDGPRESLEIRVGQEKRESYYFYVDSVYVVGDVHGRYDQLSRLLEQSGIVDKDHNWTAGKAHLVFLGDLFDRGDDVTKVLWFIYQLEKKAAEKGNGNAQIGLGTLYAEGLGVEKNYITAYAWHKMAARQGFQPEEHVDGHWTARVFETCLD